MGQEDGKLGNRSRVQIGKKQKSFKKEWVVGGIKCQKNLKKMTFEKRTSHLDSKIKVIDTLGKGY